MLRTLRLILELLAGFVGILVLIGLVAFWRLNAHPISSTFMTPTIESGIEHLLPDARAQIEHSLLRWDNVDHSLEIHADGVTIRNAKNDVIAEVPQLDVRLSLLGILLGQLVPTELIIGHPQITLERDAEGKITFGGLGAGSGDQSDVQETLQNLVQQLPRTHFLQHVAIKRTVIDLRDTAGHTLWSISVPDISLARTGSDLNGHIAIDLTQKNSVATLETHYSFDHRTNRHTLTARFDNITPAELVGGHPEALGLSEASALDLPLTGEIDVVFDKKLNLVAGQVKLQGDQGTVHAPLLWDQPRPVKSLEVIADFDLASHHVNVSQASVDFGGATIDATLQGNTSLNPKRDMDFDLAVHMQNWPFDQYRSLWPKPIIPSAADWIATHMTVGSFDEGKAKFKGDLSFKDLTDINMTEGHGKVTASHGTVSYLEGMPPVVDVKADADFDLTKMSVQLSNGSIGSLRMNPFTIVFSDFDKNTQLIDIPLKLSGPVPEVIKLIDSPPLHYAQAIGLAPNALEGHADVEADLRFPLLNDLAFKDIDVKANATLTNVASTKLLKGFTLTQGALALNVDAKSFSTKGIVNLNAIPFQITWDQLFSETTGKPMQQATATALVKDDQFKNLGVDALNGTRGTTRLSLRLTQDKAKKRSVTGQADMTAADMHIDQVDWRKAAGVPAQLSFAAEIPNNGDITVKSIQLTAPQTRIKGKAVLTQDGELKSLALDPFVLGRTDAALYFSRAEDDTRDVRLEAYGKALDISGLRSQKESYPSTPQSTEYKIKVDNLFTSPTGVITQAEGFAIRDAKGWDEIRLQGLADGNQPLRIDLKPHDTQREFVMACGDFGKALKGLGITDSVSGGKLEVSGRSAADDPRAIEGTVKIGHFDVHDLPALVILLNATSPFGFMGILTSSTSFDKLKGGFRWQGDQIELKDIQAAGTSVGMNVQGKIDMNSGKAKLNGTLVPFSTANRLLGAIPVVGDLLTGGSGGGVLAVAYDIDGSLSNPKVSVNPVSLLTPGFLRTLFFGGDESEEGK